MPSCPFSAYRTSMPLDSSTLVSAKTFRTSSSTMRIFLLLEHLVARMQLLQHPALFLRELALDAVQKERGLVEEPLGRAERP